MLQYNFTTNWYFKLVCEVATGDWLIGIWRWRLANMGDGPMANGELAHDEWIKWKLATLKLTQTIFFIVLLDTVFVFSCSIINKMKIIVKPLTEKEFELEVRYVLRILQWIASNSFFGNIDFVGESRMWRWTFETVDRKTMQYRCVSTKTCSSRENSFR